MKGLVFEANEVLTWKDVPEKEPTRGEVKLKIKAAGICGSDIHGWRGITGRRIPPMIMGHEFSGEVVALGDGVEKLTVGKRVVVSPVDNCGECEFCRAGLYQFCTDKRQFGCAAEDGAFEEYLCVPEDCCIEMADGVSWAEGAAVEPLAVAVRAANRAGGEAMRGKNVFIVGVGTIGLMILTAVKMYSPAKIIISDTMDVRLELAKAMGADVVVNPAKEDAVAAVQAVTDGKGADFAFEAVGHPATFNQTMEVLRMRGRAIILGQGVPTGEVNILNMCVREPEIVGSFMYNRTEFDEAAALINAGKVDVKPMLSVEAHMSEGEKYFKKLAFDPGDLIKVILTD